MTITADILRYALTHAGTSYGTSELAIAAGHKDRAGSASGLLIGMLHANVIARTGDKWHYRWFVPDNAEGRRRAQAYLDKAAAGRRVRNTPFNRGTPRDQVPHDETPREHAYPPVPAVGVAPFPPEPLRFTVDDDGDLQITGRNTGTTYLLIPKLDAVDLLEFARRSAPLLEAA